jgi:hypothetical protein
MRTLDSKLLTASLMTVPGTNSDVTWGVLDREQSRTSGSVVTHVGFDTEEDARREAERLAAE